MKISSSKIILAGFFSTLSLTAYADYKVQFNKNKLTIPEPVVLCVDTEKGEASPESYFLFESTGNVNYDTGYSYSILKREIYYKGSRLFYYNELNCGACRGSYPDVVTYNNKQYTVSRGNEISEYITSRGGSGYSYAETNTKRYYEFFLNPV